MPWFAMGIETDSDIDYGRIFGPFPEVGQISQSFFIGLLTTDEQEDHQNIKINVNSTGLSCTWLPYIRAARTEEEQNMEAYTKNGNMYYRTLRIIKAGEELLVWYSKDFCQILGIPTIKNQDNTGGHICQACGAKFQFPYPLMAHIKFRCNGDMSQLYSKDNIAKQQCGETSAQPSKRPAKTDGCSLPVKRLFEDTVTEINNNDGGNAVFQSSTLVKSGHSENDDSESWSAFRKVEKTRKSETESKLETLNFPTELFHRQGQCKNIDTSCQNGLDKVLSNKSVMPVEATKGISQSLGILMPNSWMIPNAYTTHQIVDRQSIANKLMHISAAEKVNFNSTHQLTRSAVEGTSRQIQNKDILNKQLILDELQNFHFSHFKPTNPVVDKLMNTVSTSTLLHRPMRALGAQNWCAKCNASFRMTSDLVYHMRSHHKREFDPMKRKREEKLQCNVCQETFKERHHLTRHMTSHT